jgi:hypothetical protein
MLADQYYVIFSLPQRQKEKKSGLYWQGFLVTRIHPGARTHTKV